MFTAKINKKVTMSFVIVSIFVIGIFTGKFIAWLSDPDKRIIYEAQLNGALKVAKKYGLENVYLKDLTDFEWERVCVVLPYMPSKDIEQKTGIKYYDFTYHEGQWGLLFIDKNKDLIPVRINRYDTVDAVDAYDERYAFKGAVYCADRNNAQIVFYADKRFGRRIAALVQQ